jgi:hypothetical protein
MLTPASDPAIPARTAAGQNDWTDPDGSQVLNGGNKRNPAFVADLIQHFTQLHDWAPGDECQQARSRPRGRQGKEIVGNIGVDHITTKQL